MNIKPDISKYSIADIKKFIGIQIKNKRVNKNMTQAMLAELSGVSRVTLSKLERGQVEAMDSFIRVLQALEELWIFEKLYEIVPIDAFKYQKLFEQANRKRVRKPKE